MTGNWPKRSTLADDRLKINLTQMMQTHQADSVGGEKGFFDSLGSANIGQSPFSANERAFNNRSEFETSRFLTQSKIDPASLMPPSSLLGREKVDKIKDSVMFPNSPAFVNIYKLNKEKSLVQAADYCQKKNIPFSSEENNFYRLKQVRQRFKTYSNSINHCFETSRPDEATTGYNLLAEKNPRPPPEKVTLNYTDGQLYVPNVFSLPKTEKISPVRRMSLVGALIKDLKIGE